MEPTNSDRLRELFQKAREQEPGTSFEAMQKHFVQASSGMTSGGAGFLKNLSFLKKGFLLVGVISVVVITIVTIFYPSPFSETEEKTMATIEPDERSSGLPISQRVQKDKATPTRLSREEIIPIKYITRKTLAIDSDTSKRPRRLFGIRKKQKCHNQVLDGIYITEHSYNSSETNTNEVDEADSVYRFPVLTQAEWEANDKQKARMVKQLFKMHKSAYAFVPSGTYEINGKSVSIPAFYMQNTEVTVLEYRTFLFDLLRQNRKEDFLIAKPDQNQWIQNGYAFMEPMRDHYFSHPAYDNYPVNNISREGAELYCTWLIEEANKLGQKKKKPPYEAMRLPTDVEWMYAASGGNQHYLYPWGGPYVRNSKGCYLANFKPGYGKSCQDAESKSMDDVELNEETRDNAYIADGGMFTVASFSYAPNDFGLYCMSGNLAEMVYYTDENNTPGTKGGSWSSPYEEIQITGPDRFRGETGPSRDIGFRPLIVVME